MSGKGLLIAPACPPDTTITPCWWFHWPSICISYLKLTASMRPADSFFLCLKPDCTARLMRCNNLAALFPGFCIKPGSCWLQQLPDTLWIWIDTEDCLQAYLPAVTMAYICTNFCCDTVWSGFQCYCIRAPALQFLPQDRVVEFAKLKPKELLEETEKAIGDSSLYQKHVDLVAERNKLKTFETVRRPWAFLQPNQCKDQHTMLQSRICKS